MDKDWVDWIKEERENQGLSVLDLARKADISRQALYDYENRKRKNPELKILQNISIALGYPQNHLLEIAGIVESKDLTPLEIKLIEDLYNRITNPENRKLAENFLRLLIEQEQKQNDQVVSRGKPNEPIEGIEAA